MDPAAAGITLVATVVVCAGIGLAIGFLVDAPALLGIASVFVGFAIGFRLVYSRYRDI